MFLDLFRSLHSQILAGESQVIITTRMTQEIWPPNWKMKQGSDIKDSTVAKNYSVKLVFFVVCLHYNATNSDTHTDWGKSLILHALDVVHTPPSSCHTGKFSMPPRLRQKMRLLYLNDYGNGEHAAGPL